MRARFTQRNTAFLPSNIGSGLEAASQQEIESPWSIRRKTRWPVFLFMLGLVWPCSILVGSLRMSLYRIVLIAMILPCLGMFISGRAGRIRTVDVALMLFAFWCVLSLVVVNGIESSAQSSGIVFLETVSPYLLARCFVRDVHDFHNMIRLLFGLVAILLPFAIIEFVSGQNILLQFFAAICPTYAESTETRLGFTRVQSVFDHPILFGVFASSAFALVHLVLGYKKSQIQRNLMTGVAGLTAIMSLSAGPLVAIIVQWFLLSWNSLLGAIKVRWKILIGLLTIAVVSVQIFANRSLPDIVSSYLTFDEQSYWFRTLIWDYGCASVTDHPLFGVGLNTWERPKWMSASIDNFWLFLAVKYGLPAASFLLLSLFALFLTVGFKKDLDENIKACRTAFLITMTGFFVVSWTVDFWDAAYVLLLFLMGSGVWILDAGTRERGILHVPQKPAPRLGGRPARQRYQIK